MLVFPKAFWLPDPGGWQALWLRRPVRAGGCCCWGRCVEAGPWHARGRAVLDGRAPGCNASEHGKEARTPNATTPQQAATASLPRKSSASPTMLTWKVGLGKVGEGWRTRRREEPPPGRPMHFAMPPANAATKRPQIRASCASTSLTVARRSALATTSCTPRAALVQ